MTGAEEGAQPLNELGLNVRSLQRFPTGAPGTGAAPRRKAGSTRRCGAGQPAACVGKLHSCNANAFLASLPVFLSNLILCYQSS